MGIGNESGLEIGLKVFYPAHGVAVVVGLEDRDLGSSSQIFYVLRLARGEKVMVPVTNLERAGVRDLVTVATARELLRRVGENPPEETTMSRRERVAEYKEGLRTGAADRYTSVLQELLFRSRSAKLGNEEKRAMEEARSYFVAEIGTVLGLTPDEIDTAIVESAATG